MRHRRYTAALFSWLLLIGGCAPSLNYEPPQDHATIQDAEFIHYLGVQPMITFDEACRAVLLLIDGADASAGFEDRYGLLLARGLVRDEWRLHAKSAVDRGTLAYMIFKGCKMPGGLNVYLFGSNGLGDRRYALKEVTRRSVMPYGVPYQSLTGGEVLAAISKADDYLAARSAVGVDANGN